MNMDGTLDDTLAHGVTAFESEHEGDVVVERVALFVGDEGDVFEEVVWHRVRPDGSSCRVLCVCQIKVLNQAQSNGKVKEGNGTHR